MQQANASPDSDVQWSQEMPCLQVSRNCNAGWCDFYLYGPVKGSRHDAYMYQFSGLRQPMQEHMTIDGQAYQVYGDPAYGLSQHLCTPYRATSAAALTPQMCEFNQRMNACRMSVEGAFGEISRLWAFHNYKPQQKNLLSPVATQYRMSVFLTNLHIHA